MIIMIQKISKCRLFSSWMRTYYFLAAFILTFFNASLSFADDFSSLTVGIPDAPKDFAEFSCILIKLALDFIPYLVVIALGAFLMGLIKYVAHGDDSEKMSEGRKMMIYGILGFFFMVSVWGILGLFTRSFGLQLVIPQFKSNESFKSTCS